MSYENIAIQQANFCIAPLIGTFATIDTSNVEAVLRIKNDTGGAAGTFTLNPSVAQGTIIYGLEYVGPRSTSVVRNGMVFFTMESDLSSSCTIKKWNLNTTAARLDLDYYFTKSSDSLDKYACKGFTVGKYFTSLSLTTVTGTGYVDLTSVDTVVSGTRLFLGPSTNATYINNFEEVIVTSVSGTTVQIRSDLGVPPFSFYNSGDSVTYVGNSYLLSDLGESGDITKGTLFVLNSASGDVLNRRYSGLFNAVQAVGYSLPYYDTIGLAKASEILYVSIEDFEIKKSSRINNTLSDSSCIPVLDIDFKTSTLYRLQDKIIRRDDTGQYVQLNWTTYNYQEEAISRFTDSMTLYTIPTSTIANQETTYIYVVVRDQYGVGMSNKTVTFDKISGDSNGVFGEVNRQAITDVNGVGSISYTSGWYDQSVPINAVENILIKAHTDGSSILTGSIYIWTSIILNLKARFIFNISSDENSTPAIVQKLDTKTTTNIFKQLVSFSSVTTVPARSWFGFPGGALPSQTGPFDTAVTIVKQLQNFSGIMTVIQEYSFSNNFIVTQKALATDIVYLTQNYISRHYLTGNQDTVQIAQFRFIVDLVPAAYSAKNTVNTNIWVKMAPYGFDLDRDTLVFKVREVSYAGDTGYVDYVGSPYLTIVNFDAGGGLIGLEVTFDPPQYFHNNAIVYVYIEIYDKSNPVNRIEYDYWFTIIADYNAPYILNEIPARNATGVPLTTGVTFDIIDNEVGVNISTLELYINNRTKVFSYTTISGGYTVSYANELFFYYKQPIEIAVTAADTSGQDNVLYDMWRFTIEESLPPIIDTASVIPKPCSYGVSYRTTHLEFNIYDGGNGIDPETIEFMVGGVVRNYQKLPIIRRI